jgi:phosphoadenosine phosphosulfate reductase
VNPVATWTRRDTWSYLREHELPHNPLYDLGYASIGCAPCTRLSLAGEHEREGRWAGLSKWECGIQARGGGSEQGASADRARSAAKG